jgi:3-hydroxyisobutyrate dehydrogenase
MGYPMAGHLARAGHQVTVYNRSASKAIAWVTNSRMGRPASACTPREAAQGADIVFCCVGNDDDLRSVVLGAHGAFAGMAPGAVFVDHTTASADVARELYAAAEERACTLSMRRSRAARPGAQNGALTVMCGGDAAPFRGGAAGGHGLLARLHPAGRQRRRPTGQDGQPDLHRRAWCRA